MRERRASRPLPSIRPAFNAGLTLYLAADSLLGDWLSRVLAEKDIDGAVVRVLAPGEVDDDLLLLNPSQSLPTLADRQGVIIVPWVIAEYLDERYPHPALMPNGPAQRARARMVLDELLNSVFPAVERWLQERSPAVPPASLAAALRGMAKIPEHGYALGSQFTLVDCAWAALLPRLRQRGVDDDWSPALTRYAERLAQRPTSRGGRR